MCKHLFYCSKRDNIVVYNLLFEGYWTESNIDEIPALPGIYCVYESRYNNLWKTVAIKNLIYIGKSENVCQQIINNHRNPEWSRFLRPGSQLGYSFAEVDPSDLDDIEAAFIFHHKPLVNKETRYSFQFEKTIISSKGATALLSDFFKVDKTFRNLECNRNYHKIM
jgi:hypothetical protein